MGGELTEPLAEELFRGFFVPPALHQDIEHMPLLIDRSPQIVLCPVDRQKHLVDLLQTPIN
jgi:hypothetical protein